MFSTRSLSHLHATISPLAKRRVRFLWLAIFAFLLFQPSISRAESFIEIEPNNTLPTAQVLTTTTGTITLTGFREAGSGLEFNDFFRFAAAAGDIISLRVVPVELEGDSLIRLFGINGNVLAENDDSEDSFGLDSAILNFSVTTTGLYTLGIRGVGNSAFNYNLTITGLTPTQTAAVPEPTTLALLGTGIVGLVARRRRQRA